MELEKVEIIVVLCREVEAMEVMEAMEWFLIAMHTIIIYHVVEVEAVMEAMAVMESGQHILEEQVEVEAVMEMMDQIQYLHQIIIHRNMEVEAAVMDQKDMVMGMVEDMVVLNLEFV